MLEVIPGILEKEWSEIERKINLVKSFARTIHIDIIDGKFAPNTTFLDPTPFAKYAKELTLEIHMMVENPIQYLKPFADAGFRRFLGHVERMNNQEEFVAQGELLGEVGLAIDGPTTLDAIKVPYRDLDCILVMTIKAGESGQVFVQDNLKKVEIIRKASNDVPFSIEVDGGISDKTISESKNKGAVRFVANSFIFQSQDPHNQFNLLKKCLE
ncbi:MAG: hypothetical protein HYT07_03700 [Candidatus Levybacteria bacterium]|nr:hypothetical protein [Candidatus Levybacteria bacterium]